MQLEVLCVTINFFSLQIFCIQLKHNGKPMETHDIHLTSHYQFQSWVFIENINLFHQDFLKDIKNFIIKALAYLRHFIHSFIFLSFSSLISCFFFFNAISSFCFLTIELFFTQLDSIQNLEQLSIRLTHDQVDLG